MGNAVPRNELYRIVVMTVIYRSDQKILLVKRSNELKILPGLWEFPGGGVDIEDYHNKPMDTDDSWYNVLQTSLERETREETGLQIGKATLLEDIIFKRIDGIMCLVLVFIAELKGGEMQLSSEHTHAEWVTVDEAENYDLIKGIKRFELPKIRDYLENVK